MDDSQKYQDGSSYQNGYTSQGYDQPYGTQQSYGYTSAGYGADDGVYPQYPPSMGMPPTQQQTLPSAYAPPPNYSQTTQFPANYNNSSTNLLASQHQPGYASHFQSYSGPMMQPGQQPHYAGPPAADGTVAVTGIGQDAGWTGEYQELDDAEQDFEKKQLYRKSHYNLIGLFVFLLYLAALCGYVYLRIGFTMQLWQYTPYGIFFFIWEMIAAVGLLVYGFALTLKPVSEFKKRFQDPNKRPPSPKQPYIIRVIVPVQYEALGRVQQTVNAILKTEVPKRCTRAVYVVDDIGDTEKKTWAAELEEQGVVYVSGRKRKYWEEINPKAACVNYCLHQLYPDTEKEGIISLREVVSVIEPGKIPTEQFFVKTIYLLDTGADVGLLVTPQCHANIMPGADIFNNSNIHFWEYLQPGYDAMKYTDLTDSTYLVRARALQSVGWYAVQHQLEDYSLGMKLMRTSWQGRYIQEYMVIQKAPEGTGPSYATHLQRSTGLMQILVSNVSPLTARLPFSFKVLCLSQPLFLIVNILTTPVMFVVPLVSLLWGIFPMNLNFHAALAITIYYPALLLLKYYGLSLRQVTVLWFAYVSNVLLWITHLKALLITMMSTCTSPRLWLIRMNVRNGNRPTPLSKRMPPVDYWFQLMLLVLQIVIIILAALRWQRDGSIFKRDGYGIEMPYVVSFIWVCFNMVPYVLLLVYGVINKGSGLKVLCMIGRFAQLILFIAGIVWLWVAMTKEIDYKSAVNMAYDFYDAERSGVLEDKNIPWRKNSLVKDLIDNDYDMSGGWYMDGRYGAVKATVPTAFAAAIMSWGVYSYRGAHYELNQFSRVKDGTLKHGLDWLNKAARKERYGPKMKEMVAYVGNVTHELNRDQSWGRPEDITLLKNEKRNSYSVKFGTQLGASLSAALAAGHTLYADEDTLRDANEYLQKAELLYDRASIVFNDQYEEAGKNKSEILKETLYYDDVPDLNFYSSETYYDDLMWAAVWMLRATDKPLYHQQFDKWYKRHTSTERPKFKADPLNFDYSDLYWGANVAMATNQKLDKAARASYADASEAFLTEWVCASERPNSKLDVSPLGRVNANKTSTGEPPFMGNTLYVTFLALEYSKEVADEQPNKAWAYRCWAYDQVKYILGVRTKFSLMVGYGDKYPLQPGARAASCPKPPQPCDSAQLYRQQPNPQVIKGAIVRGPQGYTDDYKFKRSSLDSEIRLEWNAGLAATLTALMDLNVNEFYCRQGLYGYFQREKDLCKQKTEQLVA